MYLGGTLLIVPHHEGVAMSSDIAGPRRAGVPTTPGPDERVSVTDENHKADLPIAARAPRSVAPAGARRPRRPQAPTCEDPSNYLG